MNTYTHLSMDEEASTEADVARAARAQALPPLEFKCTDSYVTEATADPRPGRGRLIAIN